MERLLEYESNGVALQKYGDKLETVLSEWLIKDCGLSTIVSTYATRDIGTIMIDCSKDDEIEKADVLTRQFLDKLEIEYTVIGKTKL